ncbi:hypothetical protein IJ818_04680 [bacterium]|nr:hypothetical protein [bacterium]
MNKKELKKKDLKKAIKEKEKQLAKLKLHVDKSETCSSIYNKVVLEKAIMKKELEEMEKNPVTEKVKDIFRKKDLICDNFKTK